LKLVIHLLVLLCCFILDAVAQAANSADIPKTINNVTPHIVTAHSVTLPNNSAEHLVVVMGEDTFPYQYVDNDGEPTGLLVELWKEWGRQTQTQLIFVPQHWNDSLVKLQEGKAQVHLGMAKTAERQQRFDFAMPIAEVGTFLYLHQSLQGKKTIHDLVPYQIGIVTGSSHEFELLRIEPKLVFKRYVSREALLKAVSSGEIVVFAGLEGYLKDPASSLEIATNFPISARIQIQTMQFYPAVQQGDRQLLDKINTGFQALSPDFIKQTERRWLGYHRQKNGLVIAMHLGFDPYVNLGVDGLPHGLYVDMWQRWSEKTGIAIDFISGEARNTIDDVRQGRADAHIGYPENDELKTGLTRAWPLYTVKSRLFLYQQQIHSLAELTGKRIGVVPTAPYLAALRQALPEVSLRYYDSIEAMIAGAKAGDISGFVASGAWTAHFLLLNNSWGDFNQYSELEFSTPIYVLTRSDDPGLTERIANGFRSISQQEFAQIEHKWMLNPKDHIFTGEKLAISLTDKERAYLKQLGEVKMGYLTQWSPMEFTDKQGKFAGINSDIAAMIAAQLQIKLTPVAFKDWQALIKALQQGEISMAGSVAKTPDRQQQLAFSQAYWPSPWGLASKLEQVSVFNISQLTGQRVAVVEGYHLVAQLMALQPSLKLVLVADTKAGLAAVSQGHADVFIDKVLTLAAELHGGQYPALTMSLLSELAEQQSHIGVHPQLSALVPLIDKVLAMLNNQQQQQIYARWVSASIATDNQQYRQWIRYLFLSVLVLSLVVIAVLLMNRRLNQEIRRRQSAEKQLQYVANHDALTQLPNRALLDDRLRQTLLVHYREQAQFAVLFIDLDGFKQINDRYGHAAGDELLINVANILTKAVRNSDTVARFGGDEWVILLNRVQDLDAVTQVADNILRSLLSPLEIDNTHVMIALSIGIAIYPRDGDSAIELLKKADKQMYQAKAAGGRCYRVSC